MTASFAYPRVSTFILLLAPELLLIVLCAGLIESELGPIDSIDWLTVDELQGVARVIAAP